MTDRSSRANQGTYDTFPTSWGVLFLVVAALCYYAFYWRCGLLLSGEEGIAAVVAQRLSTRASAHKTPECATHHAGPFRD